MSKKPGIPKGTRDFSPVEMMRRNYIFNTIIEVYRRYGFQQIETPAMENLTTLTGKYGDEGDRLIFKILNSGDYLAKADKEGLAALNSKQVLKSISEKALRYDLTVPFARYVVQNQNDISFPFKRYQIQPVWRADRPQRGRYREFYQCDADMIGSDSLLNEVELVKIMDEVFTSLFKGQLNYTISINNRKILTGIADVIGEKDKIIDITVAIDKLDKIGVDKVLDELRSKDINEDAINKLKPLFELGSENEENISFLKSFLSSSEIGMKGVEELEEVLNYVDSLGVDSANISFDVTLARGLNYYTGAIFEVKVENFPSICGGGRYDDLTGIFGLPDLSGVGISFGADRIYDVLLDNDLFPEFVAQTTQVLFVNFGKEEQDFCLPLVFKLREAGINTEIYPDSVKMKKQMKFANDKGVNYVVMVGSDEMESGILSVKNMLTGDQVKASLSDLIDLVKKG